MALRLSCPECGAQFDLVQAMEDADGRRLLDVMKDMQPVVIRPFFRYLKLFKPAKQALRWSRMLTLAQELTPMIKAAQVERHGISYAVPPTTWAEAMNELVDQPPKTLRLPLKGHGYLLSILAANAEKAAAAEEQRTETRRQQRTREGAGHGPQSLSTVVGAENTKPAGWVKNQVFGNQEEKSDD